MSAARSGGSSLDHVVSICCSEYSSVATFRGERGGLGEGCVRGGGLGERLGENV